MITFRRLRATELCEASPGTFSSWGAPLARRARLFTPSLPGHLGFQPGQQVVKDLLPVQLVEHLVPAAGVQLQGHVPAARRPEHGAHFAHPFPHAAHRVPVPGEEVDRRVRVHSRQVLPAGDVLEAAHHVPEHGHAGLVAAQRVGQIGVHLLLVPGEPVRAGPVGPEPAVVGPQGEAVHQRAHSVIPQPAALQPGQQLPEGHQGGGLLPGPRQDGPVHRPRVVDEVGPGEEGAHGVAQEKVGGRSGISPPGCGAGGRCRPPPASTRL